MNFAEHRNMLAAAYVILAILCISLPGTKAAASAETESIIELSGTANTVEKKTLYLTSLIRMGEVELDIYDEDDLFPNVYYLDSDLTDDLQVLTNEPVYMEKGNPEEEGDAAYQIIVYDVRQNTLFTWIRYQNGQIYNDRGYKITDGMLGQWLDEVEDEYCIESDSDSASAHDESDDGMTFAERVFMNKMDLSFDGDDKEDAESILKEYRNALNYLNEKYPSYSFTIVDCVPDFNMFSSYSTFFFTSDYDSGTYELQYSSSGDSDSEEAEYECMDNFYSSFVSDDYSDILFDMIKSKIPECLGVYTSMTTVQGMDFGEDLEAQQIIDGDISVYTFSGIFLDGSYEEDAPITMQETENYIKSLGIKGSYIIYAMADIPEDLENGRDIMNYIIVNGEDAYLEMNAFQVIS